LRAPRANHVFGTDEERIRTKNMVMDKNEDSARVLIDDRQLRADVFRTRNRRDSETTGSAI
jgi:hypothetical protein